jgi:hypothetical protein
MKQNYNKVLHHLCFFRCFLAYSDGKKVYKLENVTKTTQFTGILLYIIFTVTDCHYLIFPKHNFRDAYHPYIRN